MNDRFTRICFLLHLCELISLISYLSSLSHLSSHRLQTAAARQRCRYTSAARRATARSRGTPSRRRRHSPLFGSFRSVGQFVYDDVRVEACASNDYTRQTYATNNVLNEIFVFVTKLACIGAMHDDVRARTYHRTYRLKKRTKVLAKRLMMIPGVKTTRCSVVGASTYTFL